MTDTGIGRQSSTGDDTLARARHAASGAAESASNLAGQATGFATKAASALASEAQHRASGLMQEQIGAGADYLRLVSQTAHSAARDLESKAPAFARMVHDLADRADHFADDMRQRSVDEVLDMAWDVARRNPRMFLGGAIAVGFLLTRFAKSSAERTAASRRRHEPARGGSHFAGRTSPSGPAYGENATSETSTGSPSVLTTSGGASYAG